MNDVKDLTKIRIINFYKNEYISQSYLNISTLNLFVKILYEISLEFFVINTTLTPKVAFV